MGVVVILGTWLRLVEMVTDLSLDRYLLRAPDGAARTVQNVAHGTALCAALRAPPSCSPRCCRCCSVYGLQD